MDLRPCWKGSRKPNERQRRKVCFEEEVEVMFENRTEQLRDEEPPANVEARTQEASGNQDSVDDEDA